MYETIVAVNHAVVAGSAGSCTCPSKTLTGPPRVPTTPRSYVTHIDSGDTRSADRLRRVRPDRVDRCGNGSVLSGALGKIVTYGGDDLATWRESSLAATPAWLVYDYEAMYSGFQRTGLIGTPGTLARLSAILGHAPRSYEDYVRELLGQPSEAIRAVVFRVSSLDRIPVANG